MECKYYERMILPYLSEELEEEELQDFIKHIATCKGCQEEIAIQYLINDGMQKLEEGKSFNVEKELKDKFLSAQRKISARKRLKLFNIGLEILGILLIAGVIMYYILL
ncbi:MAG: zf-HC2 domain-containing protein [Lachnospiraceae bacterium]